MQLSAGTRLGHYEILASIGKGGMGEVYRAQDTRLRREVAVKVSGDQFSERFEREARLIASLNHPNICTLHDVGPNYLVMELIEGPTLAERISSGAIPWDESLGIALQIVAALEAAHEKGIVHRDLKPGNIKIKPDGTVKVLDFGLAKAGGIAMAQPSEDSPTLSMAATEAGVILGTVAYMSPEQAKGKPVDKRADIWAFGVVLYEMLTAVRPFRGESISETLASVLKEEPDWDSVPAKARRLIKTCLRKDPKQRLHDISDAKLLLEDQPTDAAVPVPPQRSAAAWIVAAICFLGVLSLAWIHFREKPLAVPELTRFQIPLPGGNDAIALSPDARRLAFLGADSNGRTVLWVREMGALEPHRLAGTEGIITPFFWSPDSRFLAFQTEGKLKKIDASSGPPQPLSDAPDATIGGSWGRNGVIVYGYTAGTGAPGVRMIPESGGSPVMVTNQTDIFPSLLPDGRHFIYLRLGAPNATGIYLGSLDAKPEEQSTKRLLATRVHAQYVPSEDPARGYILFMSDATLMAQAFDSSRLEPVGEAIPVAEQVGTYLASALFSASENGVLAYRKGTGRITRLSWFDRQGNASGFTGEPASYSDVALSRDGTLVATTRADPPQVDIWVYEVGRTTGTRLTSEPSLNLSPVWSPNGDRIAFNHGAAMYQKASSGTGPEQVLLQREAYPTDWSRDGRFLLYAQREPKNGFDLWALPLSGDPKPMAVLNTQFNERSGQFSPDGRWLAYASDESGKFEVYVQAFPTSAGGRKWPISQGGGDQPRWSRDGKELLFLAPDGIVMTADVSTTASAFMPSIPKSLFRKAVVQGEPVGPSAFHWDITADGKKFLIHTNVEGAAEPVTIVQNWMAGLPKR